MILRLTDSTALQIETKFRGSNLFLEDSTIHLSHSAPCTLFLILSLSLLLCLPESDSACLPAPPAWRDWIICRSFLQGVRGALARRRRATTVPTGSKRGCFFCCFCTLYPTIANHTTTITTTTTTSSHHWPLSEQGIPSSSSSVHVCRCCGVLWPASTAAAARQQFSRATQPSSLQFSTHTA